MSGKIKTSKITRMEDLLKSTSKKTNRVEQESKPQQQNKLKDPLQTSTVKGKPKSGRFWKTEKTKFSSIIKTKGLKNSFEKKQKLREKLQKIKEVSRERVALKQQEEELRKQRRRDNLKRQEENRKKSEVVQVITNTKKLKRMKKKQLRYIEKRDTTQVSK